MKTFLTFIGFILTLNLFGLEGRVVDHETNDYLPFVHIHILNKDVGTYSDIDGNFILDVTEGDTVKFSYVSYTDEVIVVDDKWDGVVKLKSVDFQLKQVVVRAQRNVSTEASTINEKLKSDDVKTVISKEEMERKGIRSTKEVIKKIVGVSYSKKNINVRGLNDRYNQTTLNLLPVPSSDPEKKNLDINLIPKSALSNVSVTKTYSPEFFSEATGAQVNVNTKQILKNNVSMSNSFGYSNGYNHSHSVSFDKKGKVNLSTNFKFSSSQTSIDGFIKNVNKQGNISLSYDMLKETQRDNLSSFITLNKGDLTVVSLLNHNTTSDLLTTSGTHFDYVKEIHTQRLTPTTNTLSVNQINYENNIGNVTIHSKNSYSLLNTKETNRTQYVWFDDLTLNTIDINDNHRFSSQFKEHNFANKLYMVRDKDKWFTQAGLDAYNSLRNFDYERYYFQFNTTSNINPTSFDNYVTNEVEIHDPASEVNGMLNTYAGYVKQKYSNDNFSIAGGVRTEYTNQSISHTDQMQPIFQRYYVNQRVNVLPSLSTKVKFGGKQLRFNYSKTLSHPQFRELTPFEYTEMFASVKLKGNPNLVSSRIQNLDLRWESNEKIFYSVGAFYKHLTDPIERINLATASGQLQSYQNSESAYTYGVEFEFRKRFRRLQMDGNLIVMNSRISINDNNLVSVVLTNTERELQGSTPIILNLDGSYTLKNTTLSATYCYSGKRLFSAGIQGLGDVYQKPTHNLNVVVKHQLKRHQLSLFANNVLSTPFVLEQENDRRVETIRDLSNPLSVGMSYKFNLNKRVRQSGLSL